jgi:hypothetical protein
MDRQLWIALADVAPAEGNDDDAFEDAAGAYVHALALADDEEDFADRVRTALESLQLELLDLEGSEPVSQRLRREGLSDALVELAIDAAREGEVEFASFHLYPWEDAAADVTAVREALAAALGDEQLVRIETGADPASSHDGFVVGLGREWVLLHWLDPSIFLNGWTALPLADVESVEARSAEETFAPAALALRHVRPAAPEGIALDDLAGLLASVDRSYRLVVVHREPDDPAGPLIGRVAQLGDDSFILRHVTPAGRWNDSGGYRYDEVTRIDFGGGYEEALALVAGEPPV